MNMHRSIRTLKALGLAAALLVLNGCATAYLVDNQVQSFARWADQPGVKPGTPVAVPQAPQIYRFDRLPSQQEGKVATGQDELENLTALALAKVGWTRAATGTAVRACRSGLPLSRLSSVARSSARSRSVCAMRFMMRPRSAGGAPPHALDSRAARAVWTARSTSAAVALATVASTSPDEGS